VDGIGYLGSGEAAPANEACRGWRTCILGLQRLAGTGLDDGRGGDWILCNADG
jgi:hypothetical protein